MKTSYSCVCSIQQGIPTTVASTGNIHWYYRTSRLLLRIVSLDPQLNRERKHRCQSTPTHQFLNKSVGRSVSQSVSRMKCGDGCDADAVILMSSSRCRLKHYRNTGYNEAYQ